MEYRKLADTDIELSLICLGTMTWGQQNSEKEAHEQMDYAFENGINFFDTAELYPIPPMAETQGKTEEYIGSWFKKNSNREKIFLASKVAGRTNMEWFRDGKHQLDKKSISSALENSRIKELLADGSGQFKSLSQGALDINDILINRVNYWRNL